MMTFEVFLKMTGAVAGYVLITALLWIWWRKKDNRTTSSKVLVGLVFGACSVAANHFGIPMVNILILNVRDIGPLSAGLFFSPISGVIAGVIGGAERILAGELWGIGRFTEVACGISTFLAGVLAAILNVKVLQGKRPTMPQAFFLGAVTEVFHMYAIFFTNRGSMATAYFIVRSVALPMILFTAVGLAACSMTVMKISKEPSDLGWRLPEEKIPVTTQFQRALLAVTVGLFAFNFITSYNLQTRLAQDNSTLGLALFTFENEQIYLRNNDIEEVKDHLNDYSDLNYVFVLVDRDRNIVDMTEGMDPATVTVRDMEKIVALEESGNSSSQEMLDVFDDWQVMWSAVAIGPDYHLIGAEDMASIYSERDSTLYESTLSDILLFTVMYMLVAMLAERLVVRNLHRVNSSLRRITGGDLKERVWVRTSAEFTELSEDINSTVTALRGYIDAAEQRMKDELKLAATIQDSALPKNFNLPAKNIDLHALMTPAKEVGGDFYDFFYIGTDQLCLVIADVSGKGVPAALFMMRAKTAIKNYARSGMGPAEVFAKVNDTLCEGNSADMFVTVWIGFLDLRTGRMQCANAGHEYPVLMRAGGEYELLKDKHGLVMAAMDGITVPEYEIQLNPGDRILVYTDGVPEAINEKKEAYGAERLVSRLNRVRNSTQEYILQDILQDIRNFAGTAEQFDDITMLGLTYLNREDA